MKSKRGKQLKKEELYERVKKFFEKNPRSRYTISQVDSNLNVHNPTKEIERALNEAIRKGIIIKISENRYRLNTTSIASQSTSKKTISRKAQDLILYTGSVDMTRSGAAFITSSDAVEDIYVSSNDLKGAMHKDIVTVAVELGQSGRRPRGKVVRIEKRAHTKVIGVVNFYKNFGVLIPEMNNIYPEVLIKTTEQSLLFDGKRVLVEIVEWGKNKRNVVWGQIQQELIDISDHDIQMMTILYANGFEINFSEEIMATVETLKSTITDEELKRRKDFRQKTTFTIDPLTAKDFDDALSIAYLDNGHIEVGVHIADVTHYLEEGSALDIEAEKRSTSVYLVDRVCPMLPEKLSNDLCSLNPFEDKYTFSAVFTFNTTHQIVDKWFGKTIIHSDRRFTYEEAQERIDRKEGDFSQEILDLHTIALQLRKERYDGGAINFDSDEIYFELDNNANPISIKTKERKDAHMLVEDFMLIANKAVAEFISHKRKPQIPSIYRVHDLPNLEKLADFSSFAKELGFRFTYDTPQNIKRSFALLAEKIKENPVLKILEPLGIRTMAKAVYSTENIGHYGLGFEHYTHFTSPIRRYADVWVHRILYKNLNDNYMYPVDRLASSAKHISDQEKKATDAERDSIKYMLALYISHHVGQEFEAIVSGMIEKGFFAEILDTKVEGFIPFSTLDESYSIMPSKLRAKSTVSNQEIYIGMPLRIRIHDVDIESRKVDMRWA